MNILFLGGIHGSGKSFMLNGIESVLPFEMLTASDVLHWTEYSNDPSLKKVESIADTQDKLINNLQSILLNNKKYILNGHFCLLNSLGSIERVPYNTFERLYPKSLYVKIADPEIILTRLNNRDHNMWPLDLIQNMQAEEINYAKELSSLLGLPIHIIDDNGKDMFLDLLREELQKW